MPGKRRHGPNTECVATRRLRNSLQRFDGKRISVIVEGGKAPIVMCGVAQFERDDLLGNVLRIKMDEDHPGEPEIIISEEDWSGEIVPDFVHGGQFCISLTKAPPPQPPSPHLPRRSLRWGGGGQ